MPEIRRLDYLQQVKKSPPLFEQLRLEDNETDDGGVVLFERNKDVAWQN